MKKATIMFWIGLGNMIWGTLVIFFSPAFGDSVGPVFATFGTLHICAGIPLFIIGINGKKRSKRPPASSGEPSVAPVIRNATSSPSTSSSPEIVVSRRRGSKVNELPDDYTVIDLETTGMSPYYDHIIEIGALKVRKDTIVNSFTTLIKPPVLIPERITDLNGITNAMVENAQPIQNVLYNLRGFIGDDLIVGHNISFDMDFLNSAFENNMNIVLPNDMVDTLPLSRRLLPNAINHKLEYVALELGVSSDGAHRALRDCCITNNCYLKLKELAKEAQSSENKPSNNNRYQLDYRDIRPTVTEFDATHPLYGKRCVFSGTPFYYTREEIAQKVVNVGGFCDNGITKKTDYLVIFDEAGKGKRQKAQEYIARGIPIEIIDRNEFFEMLGLESYDEDDDDDDM